LAENIETVFREGSIFPIDEDSMFGDYEGWNFNSGHYLFTTDTK